MDVSKRPKDGRADVLFSSPTRRNDIFLRTHSEAGTTIARIPVAFYEDNGAWSYRFEARLHTNTLDAFMVTDTEDPEVYHFEIAGTDGSTSQTSVEPQALTAPIVKVSPNFFAQLEQQSTLITDSPTQAELLTANGIEFPAGAGVFFGMLTGEFVMRNTDANHKKLSALIDKIETAGNPSGEKDEDDQAAATLESKP
ncbi:MAG: hypothetical protein O3C21_11920 [Verrucomicrobia bacterium]|nr:hypothetical protein [Verrucomicrobiota bacterium]